MIAVDTNVLTYAHRTDSLWHEQASRGIRRLSQGRTSWAIPWPCIHEFFAIVTHPRIYDPPTPRAAALDQIEAWIEAPNLVLLGEAEDHWQRLRALIEQGRSGVPRYMTPGLQLSALAMALRSFGRQTAILGDSRSPAVGIHGSSRGHRQPGAWDWFSPPAGLSGVKRCGRKKPIHRVPFQSETGLRGGDAWGAGLPL
jgi:hypothetical protein